MKKTHLIGARCAALFTLYTETSMIMRTRLLISLFLLGLTTPAAAVYVDGKEWRQLTDTLGFSYNQIDAVCPASSSFVCSGSISGTNFTGWALASVFDVRSLIESYTGVAPTPGSVTPMADAAGLQFFADFNITDGVVGGRDYTWGITSSLANTTQVWNPFVNFDTRDNPNHKYVEQNHSLTFTHATRGVWLYEATATVPIPATVWLFSSGLIGLIGIARKRKAT